MATMGLNISIPIQTVHASASECVSVCMCVQVYVRVCVRERAYNGICLNTITTVNLVDTTRNSRSLKEPHSTLAHTDGREVKWTLSLQLVHVITDQCSIRR